MRRPLLAACVLVPAAAFAVGQAGLFSPSGPAAAQAAAPEAAARPCDARCGADWMDANLRLDQIQMVGTNHSYKQKPSSSIMGLIRMGGSRKDAEALDYGHAPIPAQLDNDVRGLQFDVAYDPEGGLFRSPAGASMAMELLADDYTAAMKKPGFKTIHVLDVDYRSSCPALADCLKQVADWSAAHPRHLPIVISLHTNDARTPMPGATRPVACDAAALDALDGEVRATFAPGSLITPAQVQGAYPSLRDAALAHNWPKLGAARGKVIVVLADSIEKARIYQGARKSLEGRAMFVAADVDFPLAAFVSISDPRQDGARIARAVAAGFIVTTQADAETREARANDRTRRDAAFASGAQIVQTAFAAPDPAIGPYRVQMADNPAAMCGAQLGAEHCVRLEDGAPLRTAAAAMP